MKNKKHLLTVLTLIVFSSVFVSCKKQEKKEIEKDTPKEELVEKNVSPVVLLKNDYAIVSKISLAPGESQPTHEGENRVIYALTDYSIDWEEQGKKLGTKTWKKGDVHFHESGTHAAKNLGTSVAEWLVFSRKDTELPECADNTIENDVTSVSPGTTQTLFENDEFKLTRVVLPKGESIPMHSGINRVIYSLSDYDLKYDSDTEGMVDKSFKSGDVHWHEACKHALENNGDTEAIFLVVSYK